MLPPKPKPEPEPRRAALCVEFARVARGGLALGCALLALGLSRPAAAEVVTLQALERVALGGRATLDADGAAARAARADIDKAESGYQPVVGLQIDTGIGPGRELVTVQDADHPKEHYLVQGTRDLGQPGAFDPQLRSGVELQLKSNLYDFGRTGAAVDASRARYDALVAQRDVSEQAILDSVRAGYLQWLGSYALRLLAAQSAQDATTRRARVQALIDEGVRPQADLTPAQADEALAALELERARGQERAAKLELEQAVGAPLPSSAEPDRSLLGSDAAEAAPNTTTPGQSADDPGARMLAMQAHAAEASARAAEHGTNPVLSGAASAGLHAQDTTLFPSYSVGLALSVPLWDGGSSDASAASARAHAAELRAREQATREQRRARDARAALGGDNAARLLRAARVLLVLCEKRLREAEQAYELGAGPIDAIAQARTSLRHAQSEVVRAQLAGAQAALARAPARGAR